MFKRPVTESYPENPGPVQPRYHGRHQLNRYADGNGEAAIGCELCAWSCPAHAIYVEGADNTDEARFSPGERYGRVYQINYLPPIGCGLCVEACPTRALTMTNHYEMADDNRSRLDLRKAEPLLAPMLRGNDTARRTPGPKDPPTAELLPAATSHRRRPALNPPILITGRHKVTAQLAARTSSPARPPVRR